jgi:hypothetical protein
MTWKLWTVDLSGGWAGGTFFETAPDELVHIYGGRGQGGGGPPWTARKFRMRVGSANQKLIPIDCMVSRAAMRPRRSWMDGVSM